MKINEISAETTLNGFFEKVKRYYSADEARIMDAFSVAETAHKGQFRASGRPYITHPVIVAEILIDMGFDVPTICAALLHDTVEDTNITDKDLRGEFGSEVADLVAGVTKLDKIQFHNKEEEQAENMRKMFFAMAKDIRVMLIKLADRLHNMRALQYLPCEKQHRIAKETLEIFAPIAGRLGISRIKCELEDLCLKYLDRESYDFLSQNIALKRQERHDMVDEFMKEVKVELGEAGIVDFEISGRTKHFFSIYKKMNRQEKSIDQIYDMTAVRIIVETIRDCYSALGAIHARWKPIQGRFKDYIAVPKPNLYQSLHTTVLASEGKHNIPFEVQIRTKEMHRIAEYGIAAHWKYKEGSTQKSEMDEKLGWVKEVLSYETELKDSTEFLDIIRNDISNTNEVYVFTPTGDVKILTAGATALDFAYSVHSEVGNRCVGTKVNGKIVSFETVLNTGDRVEVMTNSSSKGPSRDWLKVVKTSSAKAKIRQFFKHELKDEYIKTGKTMIERDSRHRNIAPSELLSPEAIEAVCMRYMLNNVDEMYAAVGYGSLGLHQVMAKLVASNKKVSKDLREKQIARLRKDTSKRENSVIVKGVDDLLIRLSRCCSPVPGDKIIGYISRGRGVCIHRTDCSAVKTMEQERLVEAEWVQINGNATFPATIHITMEDKGFIFSEVTKVIVAQNLPMTAINARKDKKGNAVAIITVEISNFEQVEHLLQKIKSVKNVITAFRTTI